MLHGLVVASCGWGWTALHSSQCSCHDSSTQVWFLFLFFLKWACYWTSISKFSGGASGQASDIAIHAQEILDIRKRLNQIYVHHTGQELNVIEAKMERDHFMSAQAAKEFGLVDKILMKRETAPSSPDESQKGATPVWSRVKAPPLPKWQGVMYIFRRTKIKNRRNNYECQVGASVLWD